MLGNPTITVVMSFHDARHTLAAAVRSILLQTYSNWELILLDDGSRDGSGEVVSRLDDARIRLVSEPFCKGLAARLNQGISLARGEYVARMDADDVSFPSRLEKQLAYLESHPEVDLLATDTLMVDDQGEPIGILAAGRTHEEICARPWVGFPMPHPTWMGRTTWFRAHPYDESARKAQDQILLLTTYRDSRFAGLAAPLLAYRYDAISWRKSLVGRRNYVRAGLSDSRFTASLFPAIRTMCYHGTAVIRDMLGQLLGMRRFIARQRVTEADPDLLAKWAEIREMVHQDLGHARSRPGE